MTSCVVCPLCFWKLLCQFVQLVFHVDNCFLHYINIMIWILSELIVTPTATPDNTQTVTLHIHAETFIPVAVAVGVHVLTSSELSPFGNQHWCPFLAM